MARRNLNPTLRNLVVFERKNAKSIVATGCFSDQARGELVFNQTINITTLNATQTQKIEADKFYVGILEYLMTVREYNISSIYNYTDDEPCYIICRDMSKEEEALDFATNLSNFYSRIGLEFNVQGAIDAAKLSIERSEPMVLGYPTRFANLAKIIPSLKIPTSNYHLEVITKFDVDNGIIDVILMDDDDWQDWNSVFEPVPTENIRFDKYIMPQNLSAVASIILPEYMNSGENTVLGFVGDSGNGKTVACQYIAAYLTKKLGRNIKFTKVNVPLIARPSDFFLERDFRDGSTVNDYTEFYYSLKNGDAVILLDEVNRVPSDILNAILGITDGSGYFALRGQSHEIGKNITFIFTYNVGYQYTGTFDIDFALASRIKARVDFSLPNVDDLVKIGVANFADAPVNVVKALAILCHELDKMKKANTVSVDVSVRALLNWLFIFKPMKYNPNMLMDAMALSCINFANDDDEKAALVSTIKTVMSANGIL
jgi:MoxR-like ATPase